MKIKTIAALGTVLCLSSVLIAQEDNPSRYERAQAAAENGEFRGGPGKGRRGPPGENPGERRGAGTGLFERIDINDDESIDEIEFIDSRLALAERTFNRMDRDDDDMISREEAEPRGRGRLSEVDREAVLECVRETYADWDGGYEVGDRFDAIDTNDDDYISLDELSAALQERSSVLFARIDTDDNDLISLEELNADQKMQFNVRRAIRHCLRQEMMDPFEV